MSKYRFDKKPKSNLFNHLQSYQIIIVTGPHRAGTTITAAMITNDLDYDFVEDAQGQIEKLPELCRPLRRTVFHAPSRCHYVHHLADIPGLAVVMVIRDIEAIIASEKRIPWAFEPQQIKHYKKATPKPEFEIQSPVSRVKYRYWQEVQKPIFDQKGNGYEVYYPVDIKNHSMWVSYAQRSNFTANQLEIGKPHGPRVQGRRLPNGIDGNVVTSEEG